MKKPFILALDDDPSVLKAIERDLKSKFGANYRILASDSPKKALDHLRQLTARGDRTALFVVDQRMPEMSGTDFLREAIKFSRKPAASCSLPMPIPTLPSKPSIP